ncbi:MAG TPA: sulfate adenylyltransferase subunit CysN, partial [Beijerinckiaceae bacterium]|nr:sulfate adenylyltransferase subunit CysN [Beijerinckiaceae bacterium]
MSSAGGMPTLRFLTCGSVDDGKSTLIGRLLFEQDLILEDQLAALAQDSLRHGTIAGEIDYALLVDGLEAEREQGITIDVAYRYFATSRRAFIVADTPGHEQYTRNMITGASNADLAVLLIDASKGLLTQTHRHSVIASLIGIQNIILAVNKMDLVNYDQAAFEAIVAEFHSFVQSLGFKSIIAIPLSARRGDNISTYSAAMPWYSGGSLLEVLETVDVNTQKDAPLRLPIQWVNRPNSHFRGFAGTIASGSIALGDEITVAISGKSATVTSLFVSSTETERAEAGDAVTVVLSEEVDISRGDVLCRREARPDVGDHFTAHIIWMSEERMHVGRSYFIKIGSTLVPAVFTELHHRVGIPSLEQLAAKTLELNEIAVCKIATARTIAFDSYKDNRATGGFIVIDRADNTTVAAGMIDFHLRRSENVRYQALSITKGERSAQKRQLPKVLWFTGISAAGKSTIANLVETKLHALGLHTMMLDGDNIRHGLNRDLGFAEDARIENVRRVGEVSKLMTEAGLIVLCSFISPFAADRQMVRELLQP